MATTGHESETINVEGLKSSLQALKTKYIDDLDSGVSSLDSRVDILEEAVGSGGSVDTRISNAINALDSTKSQIAGADGLALSITETDGKITSISGSIASNTYAPASDSARITSLETAVGSGGSIDTRISNAVATETIRAQEAENSLNTRVGTTENNITSLNGRMTTAESSISNLQSQYAALTQSDIIVGALPASGTKNKIYRVPGTTSYSDYMWDGTQFIKMAEYDNAIDNIPTGGSENLTKSGGVVQFLKNLLDAQHQTSIYFIDGKFISIGNVGSQMNISYTDNASYRCTVVCCRDNKLFFVNGQGGDGPRSYAFLDSNNVVLSKSADSERYNGFLIAPEDADKVIFNDYLKTADYYVFKANCNDMQIHMSDLTNNQFIDVSEDSVTPESYKAVAFTKSIIVDCRNCGDYIIYTGSTYDVNKYAYGFLDEDNTVIERSEPTATCIGRKITVPNNAVYFVANFTKNRPMELYIRNNSLSLAINKRHVVIAANDSSDWDKQTADFVCSGSHDEITITNAIYSLRKGGTVEFCDGTYEIQGYTYAYTDSVFATSIYCAIYVGGVIDRHIILKGRTRNKWYNSSYGAVLHFDMTNLDTSKQYALIGGTPTVPADDDLHTYTFRNNITIENLYLKYSRFDVPVIMVDLWNFGEAELNNLIIENDRSIYERYTHQTISIPVANTVGVRGLRHSKETQLLNNVVIHSFYYGMFMYGSDHTIMTDCMVARCVYGYWFKDLHKVATLINCCDEGNTYMPKFNGFGKISMIDFNVERFSYPVIQDAGDRRSSCPDTWGGDISFVMQADTDYNYSGSQFFQDGNGKNFDCVNMRLSKQGASLPFGDKFELYQRFFNTTTNKMMIWNGSEWV